VFLYHPVTVVLLNASISHETGIPHALKRVMLILLLQWNFNWHSAIWYVKWHSAVWHDQNVDVWIHSFQVSLAAAHYRVFVDKL